MEDRQSQNVPETVKDESSWSSPVKISRKVRELAQRSHSALRSGAVYAARHPDIHGDDLGDLHAQVARLQQKIHERRLQALIPWVDALRRELEK